MYIGSDTYGTAPRWRSSSTVPKTPENAVSLTPPRYDAPSTSTPTPVRSPTAAASRSTAYAGIAALASRADRTTVAAGSFHRYSRG